MSTITIYTYAQQTGSAGRIAWRAEPDEGEELSDDYVAHTGTRAELIAEARDDLARKYGAGSDVFHHRTARTILHHLGAPIVPEYTRADWWPAEHTFDELLEIAEEEREADPSAVDPSRLHIRPDGHVGIRDTDTIFATSTDKE